MLASIIVDDVYVGESAEFAEFVIQLNAPATDEVTVRWGVNSYTASYYDYTDNDGLLTFAVGETVKTVRVPIVNDGDKEGTEAFAFQIYNAVNATIARSVALGTITDNDAAPGRPVVSISDLVVDESDGTATFVVTLDRPATGTVSMNYATQNGSATAGQDFKAASGRLDFKTGETAKVVKVALLNDRAIEGAESFGLVLSNLVGATSLDPVGTAEIAASDRPAVQTPNLLVDDVTIDESTTFAEFVVRLDAPSTEDVTVRWGVNSYTARYDDYTDSDGLLTFAVGETVKTVRVPIVNDGLKEGTEAFAFQIYNAVNANIARPVALGTIIDNDAAPGRPVVSISDLVVDEADGTATFVVTLDRPATGTVSMNYATQNGSATAGQDFKAASGRLDFKAGETAKVVKVGLVNDRVQEGAESFGLVLSNLVGATSLDPVGTAEIAASDRPAVQTPNLLVDDVTIDESTTFAEFVVRLDTPSTEDVTVRWGVNSYTARYDDYTNSDGFLTFAAGETVKTVRVPIVNDGLKEGTEAFAFQIYNAVNATIARPVALGTIIDNDAAPGRPVVSISDLVVDEADGTATFVVTLDRPATGTVSMNYATQNGSATAGQDFKAASGRLDFKAGETAKVVKVGLVNDRVQEGAESFGLVLSNLVGATSLDPLGTAVIAASDRPAVQTPNLLVDDVTIDEGTTFAEFMVRLDTPSTEDVTVHWGVNSYTANYNDYTDSDGFLTFAAGETVKTVRVPIVNDGAKEGTEAFIFQLYRATNANIARPEATGTIVDNDSGTPAPQTVTGTDADDILFGTAAGDRLDGGRGNDFLSGGRGADYLAGGYGNDTYLVDDVRDWITERANAGGDTVQASVSYSLSANVEALLLVGGGAINGTGNDLANRLAGNDAANVLDGRAGADVLRGGGGADTFVFSTALKGNVDVVLDFAVEDTIRLSKSVFSALATGKLSASAFKETSAGGAVDADDRILYNKATGALSYDADGSGKAVAAVQFATLDNRAALTFQDLLVV